MYSAASVRKNYPESLNPTDFWCNNVSALKGKGIQYLGCSVRHHTVCVCVCVCVCGASGSASRRIIIYI
jgi:hypothetical protein